MRGALIFLAVVAALLCGPTAVPAQDAVSAPEGELELADRIVAVVDDDPILESDIRQIIGLDLLAGAEDETEEEFRRRVLDRLIEEKLRFHEIDRFGLAEIPVDEVEAQVSAVRKRFGSQGDFDVYLDSLGLDEDGLRQLIARQLMVLIFVEERLGPRVFVGLDEIRSYYETEFVPQLRAENRQVPPLQEVREDLRAVLKERRLNEEIDRWTEELRLEADVVDYFDVEHDEIPDLVIGTSTAAPDPS